MPASELVPRARHDAGPVDRQWGRRGLSLGALVGVAVAALVAAGSLGRGPLGALAWTEHRIQPEGVGVAGDRASARTFLVAFTWTEPGYCRDQFRVDVRETADTVRVGPVVARQNRLPLGAGCGGRGTVSGRMTATVPLSAPLGSRKLVGATGQALPSLQPAVP